MHAVPPPVRSLGLNALRNCLIDTIPVVPVISATRPLLKPRECPDDIADMFDSELAQIRQNPQWLLVLAAYREQQRVLQARASESDGWVSRIRGVEGVCDEELSRIHGKLIAFELLKFQLEGRTTGVRYQVARAGRELLAGGQREFPTV